MQHANRTISHITVGSTEGNSVNNWSPYSPNNNAKVNECMQQNGKYVLRNKNGKYVLRNKNGKYVLRNKNCKYVLRNGNVCEAP